MYIYTHMYIHVYTCIRIRIHVYVYVYMHGAFGLRFVSLSSKNDYSLSSFHHEFRHTMIGIYRVYTYVPIHIYTHVYTCIRTYTCMVHLGYGLSVAA